MFKFEYGNFLDKYNGLRITIRNTTAGQLVCYSMNNDGVQCYETFSKEIFGYTFCSDFLAALSCVLLFSINDEKYLMMKRIEIEEILKKQVKHFLLDYFQVEDMRDLVVRDDFFDKQMFVEP